MDYEAFLEEIGPFNRYQAFLYCLVIWSNACLSANLFFMAIGGLAPTHWRCSLGPENPTNKPFLKFDPNNCNILAQCFYPQREFYSDTNTTKGFYSVATQYGLVCEDSSAISSIIFRQMIGLAVGTILFGPLSDIYGRKKIWLISNFLEIMIGGYLSIHLSPDWLSYANWRFLLGVVMGGHIVPMWTILVESVGRKYRFLLLPIGYSFMGQIWFAFLAYQIRDWRVLTFVANFQSLPSLFLIFYFVPESPRWLMSQFNGESETKKAFQIIGHWNNRKTTYPTSMTPAKLPSYSNPNSPVKKTEYWKIVKVLHHSCTLPLIVNWITVACIMFGVAFHVGHLFGDPFLLLAATGFLPWFSYLFATFLDRSFHAQVGRKFIHCYSLAIPSVLFMIIALQLNSTGATILSKDMTVLIMITYGIADGAWLTNYQMTSELYPTEIRTTGMGLCSGMARVGAAISPYIFNQAGKLWPAFPYFCLGLATTISVTLAMGFLKETKNKPLPE